MNWIKHRVVSLGFFNFICTRLFLSLVFCLHCFILFLLDNVLGHRILHWYILNFCILGIWVNLCYRWLLIYLHLLFGIFNCVLVDLVLQFLIEYFNVGTVWAFNKALVTDLILIIFLSSKRWAHILLVILWLLLLTVLWIRYAHIHKHGRLLGLGVTLVSCWLAEHVVFWGLIRSLLLLFRCLTIDWHNLLLLVLFAYRLQQFSFPIVLSCLFRCWLALCRSRLLNNLYFAGYIQIDYLVAVFGFRWNQALVFFRNGLKWLIVCLGCRADALRLQNNFDLLWRIALLLLLTWLFLFSTSLFIWRFLSLLRPWTSDHTSRTQQFFLWTNYWRWFFSFGSRTHHCIHLLLFLSLQLLYFINATRRLNSNCRLWSFFFAFWWLTCRFQFLNLLLTPILLKHLKQFADLLLVHIFKRFILDQKLLNVTSRLVDVVMLY